jgi:hypothetical protein
MQLSAAHIYLAIEPVDMRLGIDGNLAWRKITDSKISAMGVLTSLAIKHAIVSKRCSGMARECGSIKDAYTLVDLLGLIKPARSLSYQKSNGSGSLKEWVGNDWMPNRLMIGAPKAWR